MSSDDDKLIDFSAERDKRIHEQNDKRLARWGRTRRVAARRSRRNADLADARASGEHGCDGRLGAPILSR